MARLSQDSYPVTMGSDLLESLIDARLRIAVSDGRRFVGTFMCTDRDGNAILADTHEWRGGMML